MYTTKPSFQSKWGSGTKEGNGGITSHGCLLLLLLLLQQLLLILILLPVPQSIKYIVRIGVVRVDFQLDGNGS